MQVMNNYVLKKLNHLKLFLQEVNLKQIISKIVLNKSQFSKGIQEINQQNN